MTACGRHQRLSLVDHDTAGAVDSSGYTLGDCALPVAPARHGTVCQRLGPVPHLRHFGGRPSLAFSVSHTAYLVLSVQTVGDVCIELCNGFGIKLCKVAPQQL